MSRMRSSRRERFFSTLILLFSICAIILVAAIVVDAKLNRAADAPALSTADFVDAGTPAPLTLKTADTPAPTEVPADATEAPAATPVPSETYDFLPVYTGADTEEKVVAVVLEDCSNAANLRTAASACAQMGAKLTLFPLGRVVMQQGMDDILRTCISDLGFEVENRTWSDSLIYRLSDSDMASEIWSPGIAVDYILDADYGMHLFHMRGGSGARDARTHSYLKQLGYDGIVNWTKSASGNDADALCAALKPGGIYAFTTSDEDLAKLASFMQYASGRGYRFVTVNALLGFEENALTAAEDNILSRTLPAPQYDGPLYVEQRLGDRAYQVYLIQQRLTALGYLPADGADGVFGDSTSSALCEFQAASGILASGVATTETQTRLFADDAVSKTGASYFN